MARKGTNTAESVAILNTYGKLPDFKATMAKAKELGTTLSEGGVRARMVALAFRDGVLANAKGMTSYDVGPLFAGFAAGWYDSSQPSREPLDKKSYATTRGTYQTFANAGLRWGAKGQPLVAGIMAMTNTPQTTRAAKVNALLESDDWQTKAPDAEAIAKATGAKKSGKGKRKPAYNGNGVLRGLCSGGEAIAAKSDFIGWLQDRPIYAPLLRDYFEAIAAIRLAMTNADKVSDVNRSKWTKAVKAVTTAAGKLPDPARKSRSN